MQNSLYPCFSTTIGVSILSVSSLRMRQVHPSAFSALQKVCKKTISPLWCHKVRCWFHLLSKVPSVGSILKDSLVVAFFFFFFGKIPFHTCRRFSRKLKSNIFVCAKTHCSGNEFLILIYRVFFNTDPNMAQPRTINYQENSQDLQKTAYLA